MDEKLVEENIKQLFINLTTRYKKANTMNVGYDNVTGENIVYVKVMITSKENDFMQQYLSERSNTKQ